MTKIPAIAGDAHAWAAVEAKKPIDAATARAIASWWMQAPNGHAGTFTALALGEDVAKADVLAAIDSEYETALPDMRVAFDNLRTWVK